MSNRITYIGRNGSKCFFAMDRKFIDKNKQKACELIAFYTLATFGHDDKINYVLISTKNRIVKINFQQFLDYLAKYNFKNKIFHVPPQHDIKLFYPYEGNFITQNMYKNSKKNLLNVNDNHKFYACQYDTYNVGVYTGNHVLNGYGDDSDDSDDEYASDMLVMQRITDYETNCEPHCDEETCALCDCDINECNFTFDDENESDKFNNLDSNSVRLNNLIFDFKKYTFNIDVISNNEVKITFDKKAVGGYQHASFSSGAVFEVQHAVPGTLEYVNTTYVNEINIKFLDENTVISEYKAIDVL
ncbi:hypothetical protein QLL95_gp0246 [Cotonvirus japonicus]|uniref:Uncharacterized protein n=1 Tax=Cotonvirus japonicus TaxID=2811091 RepID=A0ABM7NRE6_9VIRU|nr:hypothetical protein QLL95_gp0246 [Cotonvirus japonicus]BCS82735.1 hypothetical protein [Cotonvirus japonicus]